MISKREMLARALVKTGICAAMGRARSWSGLMTLNYHRIGDSANSPFDRGLWSADTAHFERQLKFLKRHCDVISLNQLAEIARKPRGRYVMITFDDGYRDNFELAFPILQRQNLPAIFFLSTGFLDNPRLAWWDEIAWMVRSSKRGQVELQPWIKDSIKFDEPAREQAIRLILRAYKKLPGEKTADFLSAVAQAAGSGRAQSEQAAAMWMNWDMVRTMRKGGMEIGGHTVNHPILGRLPEDQQSEEISGCLRRIAAELPAPATSFSYPVGHPGDFNEATRRCLQNHGIQHGFSFYGGIANFNRWDNYDIPRLAVESDMSFDFFRAMVLMPQIFGQAERNAGKPFITR